MEHMYSDNEKEPQELDEDNEGANLPGSTSTISTVFLRERLEEIIVLDEDAEEGGNKPDANKRSQ